jgi:ABC-2 type transport system permease protein
VSRGVAVTMGLAGRNLLLVRRMPSVFIPSLVMPLFILVATSGAFRGIGALPAFAGHSYLAFTIPLAVTMGAGFAGVNSGMTLARDLEGGFFDRLQTSPAPRLALLGGPLLAAMARSLFTTTVVFVAGLIGGVALPGGLGTLIVYLLAMGWAAAASAWAMGVALRARTIQSAPLMQVVVFLAVFTSVAYTPRSALTGWLHTVANWNPVTRILESSRAAELTGVAWAHTWPGLAAVAGLLAVLAVFALTGLARLNTR